MEEKEANRLKETVGLAPGGPPLVARTLRRELTTLLAEVNKSVDYFNAHYHSKLTKVILTGGTSLLPYSQEFWQGYLSLPVEPGRPWLKLDLAALSGQEPFFTNVLGLALRGQNFWSLRQGINLLKYRK